MSSPMVRKLTYTNTCIPTLPMAFFTFAEAKVESAPLFMPRNPMVHLFQIINVLKNKKKNDKRYKTKKPTPLTGGT